MLKRKKVAKNVRKAGCHPSTHAPAVATVQTAKGTRSLVGAPRGKRRSGCKNERARPLGFPVESDIASQRALPRCKKLLAAECMLWSFWCGEASSQRSCQMAATQIERTNAKRCVSESRTGFKNDADATSEPSEGGPADWTRRKAQAYCVLS